MRYLIRHETRLVFEAPVREHHCEVRLVPTDDGTQKRLRLHLAVDPDAELRPYTDAFGNVVHHFDVFAAHTTLATRVEAEVETLLENPFGYMPVPVAREREWLADALRAHPPLWDFVLHRSTATPALSALGLELAAPLWEPGQSLLEAVQTGMAWVADRVAYEPGRSTVHTPLAAVLSGGAGVCQDFAHLLIALVRSWDVPARYVMGYVDRGDEGGMAPDQATHAWAEVLIPGAGWRGFDAVHGLVVNDAYVKVAFGRDYWDAAPQRGTFQGPEGSDTPEVTVAVVRQDQ